MTPDRFFSLMLLLASRDAVTTQELASALGVSLRTITRDLNWLRDAGLPVTAQRGRLGGVTMLPGSGLDLTRLTPGERDHSSWLDYARSFAAWFHYSGLAVLEGDRLHNPPDGHVPTGTLRAGRYLKRQVSGFTLRTPKTALDILSDLARAPLGKTEYATFIRHKRRAIHELIALNLAHQRDGEVHIANGVLDRSSNVRPSAILAALHTVPGGSAALQLLERDPKVSNHDLGQVIHDAIGASWGQSTVYKVGKDFRAWAKHGGLKVSRARAVVPDEGDDGRLF